jgi:hypothetical protein
MAARAGDALRLRPTAFGSAHPRRESYTTSWDTTIPSVLRAQEEPESVQDKVRAKTGRTRGESLERIIGELNPMLRGWFVYFQSAIPTTFEDLDGFIRRRLRSILRKQDKRPAFGRSGSDHKQWPNAFFRVSRAVHPKDSL